MTGIRAATRHDAAAISALIVPVARAQIAFEFDQSGARHLLDSMSADAIAANMSEGYRYFVAEEGAQIRGVIGMRGENHVYQLFVSESRQRQGIGAALLRRALDASIAQFGVEALSVYSSRVGEGFYRRQGFRRTGPEQKRNGVIAIPMQLDLAATGVSDTRARSESPHQKDDRMQAFPDLIRALPPFEGQFEAHQLDAGRCKVLFVSYPAGTRIDTHTHDTENCGVVTRGELILVTDAGEQRCGPGDWYHLAAGQPHAARFDVETAEIEFWFERG